ncbi:hypothetical protein [Staphylococcus sp. GDY8P126P]|uniref:hypothetical protein n=1 Tax=Staphylococcus TaxID=1279 RepID=UPI001AEC2C43|nr:hypothetical protein [Staphylococcus sp. GDY8P126P]
MKFIQVVISLIGIVGSILIGGIFALSGLFQLLGVLDREGMGINLIFGFGVLFIGCVVVPYLAKMFFGTGEKRPSNNGNPISNLFGNIKENKEIVEREALEMKEDSLEINEMFNKYKKQ